jgi:putative protein-disulfide isomerase
MCWLSLVSAASCQDRTKNMTQPLPQNPNPLLCDPEAGLCEIPGTSTEQTTTPDAPGVRIIYFTDPICSACWSIEPQLRKLLLEYGNLFHVEYHMGGLLPSWDVYSAGGISKPTDVAHHWEEMSRHFGMPIDGDVWLKDPLNSSYPPCIAFKAAELQGGVKAANFLRRIREMVFLENRNITRWEHLRQAAQECGLDTTQLVQDYNGRAQQLFRDDLALARAYGVRGFPALYFRDSLNNQTTLYGFHPYNEFEQALKKLIPNATKRDHAMKGDHAFMHFTSLTALEYATLAGVDRAEAERSLAELEKAGKIERFPSKNGDLWRRKKTRQ